MNQAAGAVLKLAGLAKALEKQIDQLTAGQADKA